MQYFVTGASGFIGRRLVKRLLQRRGSVVHVLMRESSHARWPELTAYWGAAARRVRPV